MLLAQCSADYKISRRSVALSAVRAKVVSGDPSRVFLSFSDSSGVVFIGDATVASLGPAFITLDSTRPVVQMPYNLWGPIIQEEWWAVRTSGASQLGICEVFYIPSPRTTGFGGV